MKIKQNITEIEKAVENGEVGFLTETAIGVKLSEEELEKSKKKKKDQKNKR